jgi:hypothetical protein
MRHIVGLAILGPLWVSVAAADGETTPMIGGSVVMGTTVEDSSRVAGVELEAAWWWGPIGIAVEASGRAASADDGGGNDSRTMAVGGSVRLRLLQMLVPSLLEPSDVELAVEVQGILERTWWDRALTNDEPTRQGIGIALRLRGASDDVTPRLITESRFFVRVFAWRPASDELAAARTTTMPPADQPRDFMVLVGVGAAFGGGEPRYLEQFRRHSFGGPMLRPLSAVAPE